MTHEEQVLIRGKVFLYRAKAPFVKSGVSVHGALEYHEASGRVRCHECGDWHPSLGGHITRMHKMDLALYRSRHGLASGSPLYAPGRFAAKISQKANPAFLAAARDRNRLRPGRKTSARQFEKANEAGLCQAQILARLEKLCIRLGRKPTHAEVTAFGMSVASILLSFNTTSLANVIGLLNLDIPPAPRNPGRRLFKYSKNLLIELMRDFVVKYSRLPRQADYKMRLVPPLSTYQRHFGTIGAAYEAAGFGDMARRVA